MEPWFILFMTIPAPWWMLATSFFMGYFGACVTILTVYVVYSKE